MRALAPTDLGVGADSGLVPLGPADAAAAVGGLEAAQGPREAGMAGAGAVVVHEVDRREADRLDRHLELAAHQPALGGEAVLAEHLLRRAGLDLLGSAAGGLHVARGERLQPRHADAGGVEAGAVVEGSSGPDPAEAPPVALAPAVVALADPVEVDPLVSDEIGRAHV